MSGLNTQPLSLKSMVAALALCAGLGLTPFGFEAAARAPMAALAVDGHTGKVLYSRYADSRRYPASLTKIMTLYVLFEEMRKGRVNKHTRMRFSRRASGQAPSKLGLKPGQTIRTIDAIKALITKSANDVAVVVAEHISGSEYRFAQRMTRTARRLGMRNTVFRNANGLPNSGQVTTARDMVKLAQAIRRDFPEYFPYFKIRTFRFRGHNYRNHNRLLGRYAGMEGIKTGYTRASGFNLTTSVKRGRRHVFAAVLGGATSRKRDNYMRAVLDRSLRRAVAWSPRRGASKLARRAAPKSPRRHVVKLLRRDPQSNLQDRLLTRKITAIVSKPTVIDANISDTSAALGQSGAAMPVRVAYQPSLGATRGSDWRTGSIAAKRPASRPVPRPIAASVAAVPKARKAPEPVNDDPWNIQVGAYADKGLAVDRVKTVRLAAAALLRGMPGFTQEVDKGDSTIYRARFGLRSKHTASRACSTLKRKGIPCIVLKN
ncbi:MAG: D-alanyl-D-alanine carboxypeptidase [Hyphomicrobiales bacterium]|nr:MAG: D-alanyl-D-alanine carboxypeptidase [Hyphomicrobiales bacterium]